MLSVTATKAVAYDGVMAKLSDGEKSAYGPAFVLEARFATTRA